MQANKQGSIPVPFTIVIAALFFTTLAAGIYLLVDRGFSQDFGLGLFAGLSAMGGVGLMGDGFRNPPMWGGPVFVVLRVLSLGLGLGIIAGDLFQYVGWGALWGLLGGIGLVILEILARRIGATSIRFRGVVWSLVAIPATVWSIRILVESLQG